VVACDAPDALAVAIAALQRAASEGPEPPG
jgi:hypothetical protein